MAVRLQGSIERERALEAHRLELITAASHDLRTPLASLRAMIEAIEDGVVAEGPERDRYLREMGKSVDSLTALTDDLFDLIKLDAGQIEAETEQRSPRRRGLGGAGALRGRGAGEGGDRCAPTLGDAEETPDSPRVARVIQNLVQNAIRHTPPGGVVMVRAQLAERRDLAGRRGRGGGDPRRVDRQGLRAVLARRRLAHSGGSGLGLTLVKRIVEGLGGEIAVSSAPMGGARFAVSLPAALGR